MTFATQRNEALAILGKTGLYRSSYAPPALRFLWWLGLKVRPPHFAPFWATAIVNAVWFSLLSGPARWIVERSSQRITFSSAMISATVAGVVFGLLMATYFAYGKSKYHLPSWRSFG